MLRRSEIRGITSIFSEWKNIYKRDKRCWTYYMINLIEWNSQMKLIVWLNFNLNPAVAVAAASAVSCCCAFTIKFKFKYKNSNKNKIKSTIFLKKNNQIKKTNL